VLPHFGIHTELRSQIRWELLRVQRLADDALIQLKKRQVIKGSERDEEKGKEEAGCASGQTFAPAEAFPVS